MSSLIFINCASH